MKNKAVSFTFSALRFVKYFSFIIAILTVAVMVSGCIFIPNYSYYNYIDPEGVTSVEIYALKDSNNHLHGFWEKETPDYTLMDEQQDEFIEELSGFRFDDHFFIVLAAMDPSFSYGDFVVRVNIADGSSIFISNDGYGETIDIAGNVIDSNHYSSDDTAWAEFIRKYINDAIENDSEE